MLLAPLVLVQITVCRSITSLAQNGSFTEKKIQLVWGLVM